MNIGANAKAKGIPKQMKKYHFSNDTRSRADLVKNNTRNRLHDMAAVQNTELKSPNCIMNAWAMQSGEKSGSDMAHLPNNDEAALIKSAEAINISNLFAGVRNFFQNKNVIMMLREAMIDTIDATREDISRIVCCDWVKSVDSVEFGDEPIMYCEDPAVGIFIGSTIG